MREAILHLNYWHVLVVTLAGFLLGCLWSHGPLLGNAWMAEMKLTKEAMEAAIRRQGLVKYVLRGLGLTFLSTFGLAALIAAHGSGNWTHGMAFGAFVGLFGPGVRLQIDARWHNQSARLQAINLGHEVAVYALQGALLAAWR